MPASERAVVLLSGGLDSATCMAVARADGHEPIAVSFRYGQRHAVELDAAERVAAAAGAEHLVLDLDLGRLGGSALTDTAIEVPKHDDADEVGGPSIPVTYVPARNTIFLSFALAVAEVREASAIYLGVNALDYSGYPDCRPEFVAAFQRLAGLATKAAVEGAPVQIRTPLIELTKAQIVRLGTDLGVDYSATVSCYDPDPSGAACGACDSCLLRARGFEQAGVPDPTRYASPLRGRHGRGVRL